jgi:MFS family permease
MTDDRSDGVAATARRRPPAGLRWLSDLVPERGPRRRLGALTAINNVGNGMFMTASILYFTRALHLPVTEVTIGLTVAGLIGVSSGVPIGDLADRRGPRGVVTSSLVVLGLTMLSYVFVTRFWAFLIVAVANMLANTAARAARGGLIRRVGGEGAAGYRAQLRAIGNAGIAAGALVAGLAVQLDTHAAYQALVVANALTFLISALACRTLPYFEPVPRPASGPRWVAVHDVPFMSFAALNGVMSLQYAVLTIALPLWIVSHTSSPRWTVGGVMVINTLLCMLLQVRVGRRVHTVCQGGAGAIFLVSCAVMAAAAGEPAWAAAAILAVAVVVHTTGEMWHASATFALGYELAPAHAQSQYLGLQDMGLGAGLALAPTVLAALCLDLGQPGWLLLGGLFAITGLAAVRIAAWAERTRAAADPAVTSTMESQQRPRAHAAPARRGARA